MGVSRGLILGALAMAGAAASSPAPAYDVGLEGFVPVVCRAQVEAGRLKEFCNNGGGFQVWLSHAPGAGGAVIVDGVKKPLSADGRTLVDQSPTAAVRNRPFALEGVSGPVTLTATPL